MIKKFTIAASKTSIAIAVISALSSPIAAWADVKTSELAVGAPSTYSVVKGDTLWAISGKFLKNPSKWTEIWSANKDSIKNPDLIYPGDTLTLQITDGKARLVKGKSRKLSDLHLKPGMRFEDEAANADSALSTIDMKLVSNFLVKPLMVDLESFEQAPRIISGESGRIFNGAGSKVYAQGLPENAKGLYSVYRKGSEVRDPDSGELIGYEAIHLGTVKVAKNAEISTLVVASSGLEISKNDRLLELQDQSVLRKTISAAKSDLDAKVVRIFNNTQSTNISELGSRTSSYEHEGGPLSVLIINKGAEDGLSEGNAVRIDHAGFKERARGYFGFLNGKDAEKPVSLPDETVGQGVVFKVFPRVSYVIVMNAESTIKSGDAVRAP